jgi:small subunit ribosomal protein S9
MEKTKKTKTEKIDSKYFEAVGRRKTSVARVRLFKATGSSFSINDKKLEDYFFTKEMQHIVESPLKGIAQKFKISVKVMGGGIHSQAEATRHGISRALIIFDKELRKSLKAAKFLKRDARAKERRKFGLKKARKAPQWSKR